MARNFKDLEIFRLSYEFSLEVYEMVKGFPECEKDFVSQIKRASLSVPLNIAEGCSRFSKKAFLQFLSYSYGSLREVEVLLMFCKDLKFISLDEYLDLEDKRCRISKKMFLFMKKVEKDEWFGWFKKR